MKYDTSYQYTPRMPKAGHPTPMDFLPPHDIVAEQSVIGAALIEQAAIDAARDAGLRAEDFHRNSHTMIWIVI